MSFVEHYRKHNEYQLQSKTSSVEEKTSGHP